MPVPQVSNQSFLTAIFGAGHWRDAHVTGFACDPAQAAGQWSGTSFNVAGGALSPGWNNYFTISLFDPDTDGQARRRKNLFRACHVIVVDDVGTKVPEARMHEPGVPAPSWVLETSPGNFQWGYILSTPERDAARVNALLDGLVASGLSIDGKDPGMKGVTRYVRLPVGRNTKAKYGPGGFPCRLTRWNPHKRFDIADLAGAFGIALPAPGATPNPTGARGPVLDTQDDTVFGLLDGWGMIRGGRTGDGGWHMECPWLDEHSDRANSGAAYYPRGRFRCFHGHCEHRGAGDLAAWINDRLSLEQGTSLAGLAFWNADRPLVDNLWRALVAGTRLSSQDIAALARIPRFGINRCLRAARAILGADTASVRRRIQRARDRDTQRAWIMVASAARRSAPKQAPGVPLPPDTPRPGTLAEAQASVGAALAAMLETARETAKAGTPPTFRRGRGRGHAA